MEALSCRPTLLPFNGLVLDKFVCGCCLNKIFHILKNILNNNCAKIISRAARQTNNFDDLLNWRQYYVFITVWRYKHIKVS